MKQFTFTERKTYDPLPDGRALVYFNEVEATETDTHEDGSEETRTVWRYSWTIAENASREAIISALVRVRYSADDELALSRQKDAKIAEFNAYNAYAEWCKAYAKRILEGDTIEVAKALKIAELIAYDASDAVNSFTIGGHSLWLSPERRTNYLLTIEAAQEAGIESVPFVGVTLPVAMALAALKAIDLYAYQCVVTRDTHEAAINALTSIEAVDAYDFKQGYPEKLSF